MTNEIRFLKAFAFSTAILLIFISTASGVTIFGPEKLTRSAGAHDVYTRVFETTAGTGKLIIKNGEYNGKKRVPYSISSARVTLNGTEIFGPNDFKQTVYSLEADIGLNQSNSLVVELGSHPGDYLTVSIEQEISSPISIEILSPVNGSTTGKPDILVKGTIENSLGNETGVTVNGVLAQVDGNNFAANHVPLKEGNNILEVIAIDSEGNVGNAITTVNMVHDLQIVTLTANKEWGVAPFETTIEMETSFKFTPQPPSFSGPAEVEFLKVTEDNEYIVRIITPGTYYLTSNYQFEGINYSDTIALVVKNSDELSSKLIAKWEKMKAKLINSDIQGALEYFVKGRTQARYQKIYNLLNSKAPGGITAEAQKLPSPIFVKFDYGRAIFVLGRQEDTKTMEYVLYFIKDADGLWKIYEY